MVKISSGPGFLLVHTMGVKAAYPLPHPQTHPSTQTNRPLHLHKGASPATPAALHALLSTEL